MLEYFNVVNHQYEANLRYFEALYLYYLSKECMNFLAPLLDCSGVEVCSSIKWNFSKLQNLVTFHHWSSYITQYTM